MRIIRLHHLALYIGIITVIGVMIAYVVWTFQRQITSANPYGQETVSAVVSADTAKTIYQSVRNEINASITQQNLLSFKVALVELKNRLLAMPVSRDEQNKQLSRILLIDRLIASETLDTVTINELDVIF